jgi:enoyl-CoA hydratase
MSAGIRYEQIGNTALIVLDDGKANAFNNAFIDAFDVQLDRAQQEARAVVITGRTGVLSGGFDLNIIRGGDEAAVLRLVHAGGRLLMRLYEHPQPLVVGASGHAVALGALILLCADYRCGARGAFKIGLNETAIGLTLPEFALALAGDRLSKRRLTEATLCAQLYDPDAARDVGYLDDVVEPDRLRETALGRAAALASLDAQAFAASKKLQRGTTITRVLASLPKV